MADKYRSSNHLGGKLHAPLHGCARRHDTHRTHRHRPRRPCHRRPGRGQGSRAHGAVGPRPGERRQLAAGHQHRVERCVQPGRQPGHGQRLPTQLRLAGHAGHQPDDDPRRRQRHVLPVGAGRDVRVRCWQPVGRHHRRRRGDAACHPGGQPDHRASQLRADQLHDEERQHHHEVGRRPCADGHDDRRQRRRAVPGARCRPGDQREHLGRCGGSVVLPGLPQPCQHRPGG